MKISANYLTDLSSIEITTLFKERISVFVVEQNCPYQEIDEFDEQAIHVRILEDNSLVAYSRIYKKNDQVTFGRVMVKKEFRKKGLGYSLVDETLRIIEKYFPDKSIKISAQTHLTQFYASFGFVPTSASYLEDGIPHTDMTRDKKTVIL